MTSEVLVNIGSINGLLLDGTNPSMEILGHSFQGNIYLNT